MRGKASKDKDGELGRRLLAEAFGTMALLFVAVGADAAALVTGGEVGVADGAVPPALLVAARRAAHGEP